MCEHAEYQLFDADANYRVPTMANFCPQYLSTEPIWSAVGLGEGFEDAFEHHLAGDFAVGGFGDYQ